MSQDINTITKRPRRTRVPRNRPVLVSNTATTENAAVADNEISTSGALAEMQTPTTGDLDHNTEHLALAITDEPAKPARRLPRLPGFFSSVARSEQESTPSKEEVVEARMARAHKNAASTKVTEEASKTKEAKPAVKPVTKAQAVTKPKMFKPRHFVGLVVYLLAAQVVLPEERTLALSLNIEHQLFVVPGMNLPVQTSFLLNIATLVLLLYALVALDFLPSGKQYKQLQEQNKNANATLTSTQQNPRQIPPTVRPGVQGESDDLYKNYRMSQRKKR
ncbi:hypothetical protein ccbrp13_50400 [Ktedonobacteria bacterium brp13]|nr:hypothetical protein ccbrp13_50400 [Ktedonobacteria bacterium brp13]